MSSAPLYIKRLSEQVSAGGRAPGAETWCIARPERGNALGPTLAAELTALAQELTARLAAPPPKPRCLVMTAEPAGDGARRTWIAGGDLKELVHEGSQSQGERYAASLSDCIAGLDRLPLPVVIAVDGDAIGGGAELALAGDIRVMTRASRLVFRQLAVGLATGYGGARRLVSLVGLSRAQDLLFSGRTVTADECLAMGLVHEVVEDAAAMGRRLVERAAELAALEPAALAAQKAMLWHAVHSHPGAARAAELALFRELWGNPTHRRFLAQFNAKARVPR